MKMTTARLVLLRLFNATLGRFAPAERALRWFLVEVLIRRKASRSKYVASSRFFDMRELK